RAPDPRRNEARADVDGSADCHPGGDRHLRAREVLRDRQGKPGERGEQFTGREVEGRQFYWNFVYPNSVVQVERMRVPAGRDIKLDIVSEDVAHSWWIPPLQGKFDAIPGKTNHLHFTANRVGTYEGQCGEFCGYEHAHMFASVQAIPNGDFQSWYDKEAQRSEE